MMTTASPIHPDDVLLYHDVKAAARRVAVRYNLPLKKIEAMPMPTQGMIDHKGHCTHDGIIRIVFRCTEDGAWCQASRSPEEVWSTVAHELAHLRYWNHGAAHNEFWQELLGALKNQQLDHREKVLARLVKMQKTREGEAALGNLEAAEAFAAAINRMLIEHELNPSDIDYARAADYDPVVEVEVDRQLYKIDEKHVRIAWQEALARVVAKGHLCTFLIRPRTNRITFVGTRSHAVVAEYAYGILVRAAADMSKAAYHQYGLQCGRERGLNKWVAGEPGFCESWLASFVERIAERLELARKEAVTQAAVDVPGGTSQALMRLDGALLKARAYVDDKFKGRKAHALAYNVTSNTSGAKEGRAAADRMAIGRKGVAQGVKGLLK